MRPAVEHMERSLKALQEAVAGRRADIAAKEAALAVDNPPAFRALQACTSLRPCSTIFTRFVRTVVEVQFVCNPCCIFVSLFFITCHPAGPSS